MNARAPASKPAGMPGQQPSASERAPPNRLARARARTRQKLIEAAQRVMGRKGVEAATIAEITEEADVGFGSFYNHFLSKEQIANEVFAIRAEELARELERIGERVSDIALAVSFIQRWFIERGRRDPVWGWFLIHADAALQQVEFTFRARARADLLRGVEAGRFDLSGIDTVVTITLASIVAVMRRILENKAKPSAASEMVEALLRMYGLSHAEARGLARERLPSWIGKDND